MGNLIKVFKVHAKINQQTTNFHQGFGEWRSKVCVMMGKALVMNKFQNHFLVDENHFLMMKTTFFVMKTIF